MSSESAATERARVVVLGASGNIGTSVVNALGASERVGRITAVARRVPDWSPAKTTWRAADLSREEDLVGLFDHADVVVHLAWIFQPSRFPATTWRTNVVGTDRVLRHAAAAGVKALVYASSVGAYSPGPKDWAVGECWPTHGWPGAAYCREKAYVERLLDTFEHRHPEVRVVRMRPGIMVKRAAAAAQRRLFAGPLLSRRLVRPERLPAVPDLPGLRFQVLHSDDAADAFCRAVVEPVRGAFNLGAEPVLDAPALARLFGTRVVPMPARPLRSAMALAWRAHVIPAPPGLFDALLRFPVMDTSRAREELCWTPRYDATQALTEVLCGLREGTGDGTAPLASRLPAGRLSEVASGVGRRE